MTSPPLETKYPEYKPRHTISSGRRFRTLKRDGFRCKYCGRNESDNIKLEVDHIIPKSSGGTDEMENLITSCQECNNGKSNIDIFNTIKITPEKQKICNDLNIKIPHIYKYRGITINVLKELNDFTPKTTKKISLKINKSPRVVSVILNRLNKSNCVDHIGNWGWKITMTGLLVLEIQ